MVSDLALSIQSSPRPAYCSGLSVLPHDTYLLHSRKEIRLCFSWGERMSRKSLMARDHGAVYLIRHISIAFSHSHPHPERACAKDPPETAPCSTTKIDPTHPTSRSHYQETQSLYYYCCYNSHSHSHCRPHLGMRTRAGDLGTLAPSSLRRLWWKNIGQLIRVAFFTSLFGRDEH
jgi:hypothetical protein